MMREVLIDMHDGAEYGIVSVPMETRYGVVDVEVMQVTRAGLTYQILDACSGLAMETGSGDLVRLRYDCSSSNGKGFTDVDYLRKLWSGL